MVAATRVWTEVVTRRALIEIRSNFHESVQSLSYNAYPSCIERSRVTYAGRSSGRSPKRRGSLECRSARKSGTPSFLHATTSPSMIAVMHGRISSASRIPGKRFVKSRPFLEKMATSLRALGLGWIFSRIALRSGGSTFICCRSSQLLIDAQGRSALRVRNDDAAAVRALGAWAEPTGCNFAPMIARSRFAGFPRWRGVCKRRKSAGTASSSRML